MATGAHSVEWLRREFSSRRQKNPRFTIRAFAQYLKLPSGRVSELLSGKRTLTLELAHKIADRMMYSNNTRLAFFQTVNQDRKQKLSLEPLDNASLYQVLSDDAFHVISDWYHFAFLNLVKTSDFKPEPKWIAGRLGIRVGEVRESIQRLKRLGMIRLEDGRIVRTVQNLVTAYDVPSEAMKKSHRQDIEKSLEALEKVKLSKRDITSITFSANLDHIPKAKVLIKEFERKIARLMEAGEKTEVYNLNIQLVPLTRRKKHETR